MFIFLIFLLSGLLLRYRQISEGIKDLAGTGTALACIFIVAPAIAAVMINFPVSPGVAAGLILVASMPTTLSSGVVMTGAAGGNMAHALMITILANFLAVFTIPLTLPLLLSESYAGPGIDASGIMIKIAGVVILPLFLGMVIRIIFRAFIEHMAGGIQLVNQILIIGIIWMAVSPVRGTINGYSYNIIQIAVLSFLFHGFLLGLMFVFTYKAGIGPGRRESVIFMGGQKTLPLSVILQVTIFPQYGEALVVCVVHHVVHLLMDGYLVVLLSRKKGHAEYKLPAISAG